MVEILFVIVLMALLLAIGAVVFYSSERNTDLKATAEMVKQDIRNVYAMADSAYVPTGATDSGGIMHKDIYQIKFNLTGDSPPNCYTVLKYSWSGSGYSVVTTVPTDKLAANLTTGAQKQYIQPSASSDIQITSVTPAGNQITFKPSGSIIQTDATGDSTVTIHSKSQNKDIVITVSMFGSVE